MSSTILTVFQLAAKRILLTTYYLDLLLSQSKVHFVTILELLDVHMLGVKMCLNCV